MIFIILRQLYMKLKSSGLILSTKVENIIRTGWLLYRIINQRLSFTSTKLSGTTEWVNYNSPAKISYIKFVVHFAVMNYNIFGGVEGAGRGGGRGAWTNFKHMWGDGSSADQSFLILVCIFKHSYIFFPNVLSVQWSITRLFKHCTVVTDEMPGDDPESSDTGTRISLQLTALTTMAMPSFSANREQAIPRYTAMAMLCQVQTMITIFLVFDISR